MLQIVSSKARCRGPHPESRFETSERMGSGRQRDRTRPGLRPGLGRARALSAGAGSSGLCDALGAEAAEPLPAVGDPRERPGGGRRLPYTPEMDGVCDGEGPKVCTVKFGCRMTDHYAISCSAGGRFPSVKIILFCLISQFCKSYC